MESTINTNTARAIIASQRSILSTFFEHLSATMENIRAGTTDSRHWEVKIDKGLRDIARDCSSDTAAISKAATEAAKKSKNPFDLFLAHICTTIANATEEIAKAAELFAKNGLDIRGCIACTRTTATGHHLASTAIPSKPSKAELIKGDQVEIELTLLSTTTHKNTPTREGSL